MGFVLVNVAVLIGVGWGLERLALRFDYNVPKWREVMTTSGTDYDVLAHGNSVTLQSWDPTVMDPITGLSSYNLASGGQGWVSGELVLRHWLSRNEAPDWVVLGVFINRPDDGAHMAPELWRHLTREEKDLYQRRWNEADGGRLWSWKLYNAVPAFRYRKVLDEVVKYLKEGPTRMAFLRRGFLGTHYHPPSPIVGVGEVEGSVDIEALRRVIHVAEEAGARVILYEPPNHPGLSERNPNRAGTVAEIDELVADEDAVVAFRSFADMTDFAFDEWSGENHLNVDGAERFDTESLGPWVRSVMESP